MLSRLLEAVIVETFGSLNGSILRIGPPFESVCGVEKDEAIYRAGPETEE